MHVLQKCNAANGQKWVAINEIFTLNIFLLSLQTSHCEMSKKDESVELVNVCHNMREWVVMIRSLSTVSRNRIKPLIHWGCCACSLTTELMRLHAEIAEEV